jgi:hypothetical protein
VIQVSPQTVVRRVRQVRLRRLGSPVRVVVALAAMMVPVSAARRRDGPGSAGLVIGAALRAPAHPTRDPGHVAAEPCTRHAATRAGYDSLGPLVDTGVVLDAPNLGKRFETLIGFYGTVEQPAVRGRVPRPRRELRRAVGHGRVGSAPPMATSRQVRAAPACTSSSACSWTSARATSSTSALHPPAARSRSRRRPGERRPDRGERRDGLDAVLGPAARGPAARRLQHHADPVHRPEVPTLTAYDQAGQVQHTVTGGVFVGAGPESPGQLARPLALRPDRPEPGPVT